MKVLILALLPCSFFLALRGAKAEGASSVSVEYYGDDPRTKTTTATTGLVAQAKTTDGEARHGDLKPAHVNASKTTPLKVSANRRLAKCEAKCNSTGNSCSAQCPRPDGGCARKCEKNRGVCTKACGANSSSTNDNQDQNNSNSNNGKNRKNKKKKAKKKNKKKIDKSSSCLQDCESSEESCDARCNARKQGKALKKCSRKCKKKKKSCKKGCGGNGKSFGGLGQAAGIGLPLTDTTWRYQRLNLNDYPTARCLDGSPGGYFIRLGSERNKVLIQLQGGGWCSNVGENNGCEDRAKTDLGSTLGDNALDKDQGKYSTDEEVNPAFWNWSQVFVRYCDGASFSGTSEDPIQTSPTIYSSGNLILKAVIQDLFLKNNAPLSGANNVVVGGGSAGALSAYLHAHQWRELLPSRMAIALLPDSGFFPEWNGEGANKPFGENMKSVYEVSQAQDSLPQQCLESQEGPETYYRCMFAANVVPYITLPIFILNSKYDGFNVGKILGYRQGQNSIGTSAVESFGEMVTTQILNAQRLQNEKLQGVRSAAFVFSCNEHVVAARDNKYTSVNVNGVTVSQAVQDWIDRVFSTGAAAASQPPLTWVSNEGFGCETCCKV